MSQFDYREYYRRNLPHIQPPEATLFVTFRLDGSIPQSVLEQWRMEKRQQAAERLRRMAIGETIDPEQDETQQRQFLRRWFSKFEEILHAEGCGRAWLKEETVAGIVAEALQYRDGNVYQLDAYCIMPNHVHVVFAPLLTEELARKLAEKYIAQRSKFRAVDTGLTTQTDSSRNDEKASVLPVIMQSLKGHTAYKANQVLGRSGAFWQHESFDRVIRDQEEWERTIHYVLQNPVKAGFVNEWTDWKWSYRRQNQAETSEEQ